MHIFAPILLPIIFMFSYLDLFSLATRVHIQRQIRMRKIVNLSPAPRTVTFWFGILDDPQQIQV